jgi:hypothetical protein
MKEKFETIVAAENSSDALIKAKDALEQLGYKLIHQTSGMETYRRGTLLRSILALSPRGAQSTVFLELVPSGLSVRIVVEMLTTTVLLPSAIKYWQMELAHIGSLIKGEPSDVKRVKFKRPPILKMILIMLGSSFIAIALGAIVAMGIGNPIFIKLFSLAGLSIGVYLCREDLF